MVYHAKEKQPSEIFVGNTERVGNHFGFLQKKGLKTVRLGNIALDINGKPLDAFFAPIFIDRKEEAAYNEIMMENTFGKYWNRR